LAENPEQSTESEAGSIGWGGTVDESALTSAEASDDQWRWYKDPRLSTLGLRGLFPSGVQRKTFCCCSRLQIFVSLHVESGSRWCWCSGYPRSASG
jgi:hypothetical protein